MNTDKTRVTFIVNPISGTKSKEGIETLIGQAMDAVRFDCSVVRTEYAGHASVIASQCVSEGVDICVAVGGDGTVNEVARALVHSQTALGIVPCSSGNGLARHLRMPMEPKEALAIINGGHTGFFD